ncbi:hypothetical protein ACIRST_20815 [Kitasatospora sp. NPDC101447]|uniref:hypothetical protein n=1 Tax=Kitasatospora sp. NPDC101447 TaxID=3364102 RepID=UPI0038026817
MTHVTPLPGGRPDDDHEHHDDRQYDDTQYDDTHDDGRRPGDGGDAGLVLFAADRADYAAARVARAQQDPAECAGADRTAVRQRAQVAAAAVIAAAAAGRAAVWVAELAARTGRRQVAEYAAAVLACGRDLDDEDGFDGGVPEEVTRVLSGAVLLDDPGLTAGEGLALAAVGAIALAMPRTITAGDPVRQLPDLARHLDLAVSAGRTADV